MSSLTRTNNLTQVRAWFYKGKANRYAWPGGYPLYYITTDGASLCPDCVTKERAQIVRSTLTGARDSWALEGPDVNWEDPDLFCANCDHRIESAYAEPEVDNG